MDKWNKTMKPDPEVMDRFLKHYFGNELCGLVELAWRDSQDGKLRHAQLFDLDSLDALVTKAVEVNSEEGANAYIGAALRHPNTALFARASDDDFLCAPAYWADLDDAEAVKTAKQKCGRRASTTTSFWNLIFFISGEIYRE